jgi:hypothetical protein
MPWILQPRKASIPHLQAASLRATSLPRYPRRMSSRQVRSHQRRLKRRSQNKGQRVRQSSHLRISRRNKDRQKRR